MIIPILPLEGRAFFWLIFFEVRELSRILASLSEFKVRGGGFEDIRDLRGYLGVIYWHIGI